MRKLFLICSAVFTLWSCNRGEDDVINNPDAILEKSVKSYSVKNLKAGETSTKEGVVYYSLLNNKQMFFYSYDVFTCKIEKLISEI